MLLLCSLLSFLTLLFENNCKKQEAERQNQFTFIHDLTIFYVVIRKIIARKQSMGF
jgi:hypothetical protein